MPVSPIHMNSLNIRFIGMKIAIAATKAEDRKKEGYQLG